MVGLDVVGPLFLGVHQRGVCGGFALVFECGWVWSC